jgi:hypothetical protein
VANGIDAPMNSVQSTGPDAVENVVFVESGRVQLPGRDDPVLASGSPIDGPVSPGSDGVGAKLGHIPRKAPGGVRSPPAA